MYLIASYYGKYDRDLLNWINENYTEYVGTYVSDDAKEALKNLTQKSDEVIESISNRVKSEHSGKTLHLKIYSLPFLESNMGQLAKFSKSFQIRIMEIQSQINLLNQEIEFSDFYYKKTFDSSLGNDNYSIITDNLDNSYLKIERISRTIIDSRINTFLSSEYKKSQCSLSQS